MSSLFRSSRERSSSSAPKPTSSKEDLNRSPPRAGGSKDTSPKENVMKTSSLGVPQQVPSYMAPPAPHSPLAKLQMEEGFDNSGKEILSRFLEQTPISKLFIDRIEVITVQKDTPVQQVLEIMAKNKLISVPVRDEKTGKYAGMFDVMDLVALSLSVIQKELDPEQQFFQKPVGKVINFSTCDVFSPMNGSMSLYHLVEMFTRGIHRVPVQDEKSALWAVATQSTVVRYLAKNLKEIGRALDKPIDYLGLGKRQAISVTWTARTLDGYILLDKHKVEAIAVTDEAGVLVGALSASDLRGLGAGLFAAFQQPVREFIKGQPPPETCAPDASLKDLVAQLAATRSHRAWLVTRDRRPFGVVSNTDVMKALLLCLNVSPRRRRTRSVDFSKLRSSKVLGSTT